MTMRVEIDENEISRNQEIKVRENIKIAAFKNVIKDTDRYLNHGIHFLLGDKLEDQFLEEFEKIINIPLTVVGMPNSDNCYLLVAIEIIDDVSKTQNKWSRFYPNNCDAESLKYIVEKINTEYIKIGKIQDKALGRLYERSDIEVDIDGLKHYIIFWNLFLAAMDDDIYNEQLATVAELAACFGFDEPMMRDWCRAVEYVFAGNKLSEDCDLECETVEGARFFLHKEE